MKRSPHPLVDLSCLAVCVIIVAAFLFSDTVLRGYLTVTADHPYVAGFCKFALLATFGESLAQRLRSGRWLPEGFGLVPRAVVWGLLGVCITLAFAIFSAGAPAAMKSLGLDWAPAALAGPMGAKKVATAFAVSLTINTMFAPAMMVAHKVADLHLEHYGGRLESLRRLGSHVGHRSVPGRGLFLDTGPHRHLSAAGSLPRAVRGRPGRGAGLDPGLGRRSTLGVGSGRGGSRRRIARGAPARRA